jgi:hypothetical protein
MWIDDRNRQAQSQRIQRNPWNLPVSLAALQKSPIVRDCDELPRRPALAIPFGLA